MTLLIFARGRDGFVIVSDRKESENIGSGNEVPKYHLSKNKEFFLTLAGDGTRSKSLFVHIARPDVNSTNVILTIKDFIRCTYAENQTIQHVKGFLVIKNENNFDFYTMYIFKDTVTPCLTDSGFFSMGDPYAKLILEHLVRNINFNDLLCETVAKRLIAAISDVAETIDSVGNLKRFGFDAFAFMNSGQILHRKRYTGSRRMIKNII